MVKVIEARSQLFHRQINLLERFCTDTTQSIGKLKQLLPKEYEPVRIPAPEPEPETEDATNESNDNPSAESKPEGEADAVESKEGAPEEESKTKLQGDADEYFFGAAKEPEEPKTILAPIDVTSGLRESLSKLESALTDMQQLRATKPKSPSVNDVADDGLMDLSMPDPAEEVLSRRTIAGEKSVRDSLSGLRAELWGHAALDEESLAIIGNRFSGIYGTSASRAKDGVASEMMQIKAEIRSLKGLTLSRRNFPSFARIPRPQVPTGPAPNEPPAAGTDVKGKGKATEPEQPQHEPTSESATVSGAPTVTASELPPMEMAKGSAAQSAEPSVESTAEPATQPEAQPTAEPTAEPAAEPAVEPAAEPTEPSHEHTKSNSTEEFAAGSAEPSQDVPPDGAGGAPGNSAST